MSRLKHPQEKPDKTDRHCRQCLRRQPLRCTGQRICKRHNRSHQPNERFRDLILSGHSHDGHNNIPTKAGYSRSKLVDLNEAQDGLYDAPTDLSSILEPGKQSKTRLLLLCSALGSQFVSSGPTIVEYYQSSTPVKANCLKTKSKQPVIAHFAQFTVRTLNYASETRAINLTKPTSTFSARVSTSQQ